MYIQNFSCHFFSYCFQMSVSLLHSFPSHECYEKGLGFGPRSLECSCLLRQPGPLPRTSRVAPFITGQLCFPELLFHFAVWAVALYYYIILIVFCHLCDRVIFNLFMTVFQVSQVSSTWKINMLLDMSLKYIKIRGVK